LIGLEGSEDGNTWTIPEGAALDAPGIEAFEMGNLYFNVHTEANMPGELRGQIVEAGAPAAGSITLTFTNTSGAQPMTPPVAILHNPIDGENGIQFFEVGAVVSEEVRMIAEDGVFPPLRDVAEGQIPTGRVSAVAVGFADPAAPGPLTPGATASVTMDVESPDQVLTIVTMVVCTNDGFTGVDSRPLADGDETFMTPIYDAGSETNVTTLNYWVPPCSPDMMSDNITDMEGGVITPHPGQTVGENAAFDFEAGTELLEVSIVRN